MPGVQGACWVAGASPQQGLLREVELGFRFWSSTSDGGADGFVHAEARRDAEARRG